VRASEQRVTPRCRYFGECGGCQYQHIAYATQLEFKRRQVADLFERIGGVAREVVAPVVPCPRLYGYRNRIMVRSQWDKFKQGLNIGFIRHDNRLVVDIEECPIAEPALSDQIRSVRAHPPPKAGSRSRCGPCRRIGKCRGIPFSRTNFHILPELVRVARERLQSAGTRYLVDAYWGWDFSASNWRIWWRDTWASNWTRRR
jgi:tRNA/tmRNA/rRNA uracil-C5-methylase (TrmA/RlmC/RlmD family)